MNKRIKRIIAMTLVLGAFSTIEPANYLNLMTTKAHASDNDIYLDSLNVNGESVSLTKSKTSYTVKLPKSTDETTIRVATDDDDDIVTIDGDNTPKFENYSGKRHRTIVELEEGKNEYEITLQNGDNKRTYKLTIDRGAEKSKDDIYLDKIALSEGSISFSPDKTDYDIDVNSSVSKIEVQAKPEDEDFDVEIDGKEVDDDDNYRKTVYLGNGENEISIVVTDDDDNEREYTLKVNRGGTNVSTFKGTIDNKQDSIYLDDIILDDGDVKLNPTFNEKVTSYAVDVKEDYDNVIVKAKPADEDDLVRINGESADADGGYRERVQLEKGKNVIEIKVKTDTDEDDDDDDYEERIYKLTVYRGTSQGTAASQLGITTENTANNNSTVKCNQWVSVNGKWQYNDSLGNALKNTWFYDRNYAKNYYLQADGSMAKGWLQVKGSWYYLDGSGAMNTGWFRDSDGRWYYLNQSGDMAVNKTVNGYKLGSNGAWIK